MKCLLQLLLLCGLVLAARAQSTAFNYQGRLAAGGSPYNGVAEMQFALFSAPTGGVAVANTPIIAGVNVSGGLFAVSLDFGAGAFPGADRFLEVRVRTDIGLGVFITLTPRQPIAPTPYGLHARTAGTAQGPWVSSGSDLSYTAGRVGIGTDSPTVALEVRGTIRLGDSGQYRAIGGEENLRIIRGIVNGDGTRAAGQGFNVTRISEGDYRVDFSTPFPATPGVTATVDDELEELQISDFYVAGVFNSNVNSVRIRVRREVSFGAGTGVADRRFHFIAIGPR